MQREWNDGWHQGVYPKRILLHRESLKQLPRRISSCLHEQDDEPLKKSAKRKTRVASQMTHPKHRPESVDPNQRLFSCIKLLGCRVMWKTFLYGQKGRYWTSPHDICKHVNDFLVWAEGWILNPSAWHMQARYCQGLEYFLSEDHSLQCGVFGSSYEPHFGVRVRTLLSKPTGPPDDCASSCCWQP